MARSASAALTRIVREASNAVQRETASAPVLLARFVATRDEDAFAELVRLHGSLVWGVCSRVLRRPHDAEDAFQATFLVLARKAERISDPERLSAWLHGVALRAARKVKELNSRRREVSAADASEPEAPVAEYDEVWAALDEEIARLPAKLRQPVVLCRLEGQTYAEAARQLGCSVTAIFERLERAADLLRSRLTRRGVSASGCALVAAWLDGSQVFAQMANHAGGLLPAVGSSERAVVIADAVARSMSGSMVFSTVSVGGLLLAIAVVSAALVAFDSPKAAPASPSAVALNRPAGVDHLGDPLPPDAVVRIGTERYRTGTPRPIEDVVFLPDNRTLVSAHCDKNIRFWSIPDGKLIRSLQAPASVCCVAVSADGKRLAAAGAGACLWDMSAAAPKQLWKAAVPERGYSAVAYAPDGKTLAVTDQFARVITLLDAKSGEVVRTFESVPIRRLPSGVSRLGFSADGKTIYCGREKEPGCAWETATGKVIDLPEGETLKLKLAAKTSPEGTSFSEETYFLPFVRPVFSPDSQRLENVSLFASYALSRMNGKRISPDDRYLAAVHRGEISVWDLTTGQQVGPEGRMHGGVRHLSFSPDGRLVATFSMQSEVRVWEAETGKPLRRLAVGNEVGDYVSLGVFVPGGFDTFHYNPNTNPKLAKLPTRTARRWNTKTWESETIAVPGLDSTSSAFNIGSPDGKWFAIRLSSSIELRSRDGREARTLPLPGLPINTIAFSADSTAIGCTTLAGTLELFGVDGKHRFSAKFREAMEEPDGTQFVSAVAADGKGMAVLVESTNGPMIELHTGDAKNIRRIPVENGTVLKLAFGLDGKRLAAGTEEGKVVVWELAGGEPRIFSGHRGPVEALAFSPVGDRLASGSRDGTALIWNLSK